MNCIVCDAVQGSEDGTYFRSYGNYGSTVFDPMDGSYLDIVICDGCLRTKAHRAECGRESRPVVCEGTHVGVARTPDRKPVEFNPAVMGSYDYNDTLVVEIEEVGTDMPTVEWDPNAVLYFKDRFRQTDGL